MNLSTIDMPKDKARQAFLDYRRAVRERHNAEDEQIMRGYRVLANGGQLIRLSEVMRAGGARPFTYRRFRSTQTRLVPNLAVCRASATMCWTGGIDEGGKVEMRGKREISHHNRRDRIYVDGLEEPPEGTAGSTDVWTIPVIRAIVPTVPPALRPKAKLDGYHILFEAEWAIEPLPPVDPALLKHIAGDLYAVVAMWDLTELERAVLAARAGA